MAHSDGPWGRAPGRRSPTSFRAGSPKWTLFLPTKAGLSPDNSMPVTLSDIREAAKAIEGHVVRTPCLRSQTLSEITGAQIYLKFENHQFTASFKERGALNKLLALTPEQRKKGVIACSAGNHAQGVAYHANRLGIPAVIVMPKHTPFVKVEHTRKHGAEVILEGEGFDDAKCAALRVMEERGPELRASLRRPDDRRRPGHHRAGDARGVPGARSARDRGGRRRAHLRHHARGQGVEALDRGLRRRGGALPRHVPRAARHASAASGSPPSPRASR